MAKNSLAHTPTQKTKELVSLHATVGTPQNIIADLLNIDDKTLRKHYRRELDLSKSQANATIGGALFNKAKNGDTSAMIFWMKTQSGWKETNVQEHTGKVEIQQVTDLTDEELDAELAKYGINKP